MSLPESVSSWTLSAKQDQQVQENLVTAKTDSALPEQPATAGMTTTWSSLSPGGIQVCENISDLARFQMQRADMNPQNTGTDGDLLSELQPSS